ncbi:MAG: hypothetical protein HY22_07445 [[Candidatus Thermochlorobacteriaceae] bacterium GBChlB]|nr:MAG: hypothetical protein HY22_07445 [[Candidatus Thermochlorobacteriaceae] bacterium GBChlB]
MENRPPVAVKSIGKMKPQLVVLGTGFGAVSLIKKISLAHYDVTVVSPRNHFLFSPLLPSTTVGTIEFRSIIEPIRLARKGITYFQATAVDLDKMSKTVVCEQVEDKRRFSVKYDKLIICVGAVNNTFGIEGVYEHALFLRELIDARRIRNRIIDNFERAALPALDEPEQKRLLHTVVVGGGPTGVEFAAELADFMSDELTATFPAQIQAANITLVEAGKQILSTFDEGLADYAMKVFKRRNVTVLTNTTVKKVTATAVLLSSGQELPCGLVVWSTGNGATAFVKSLPFERDKAQRLVTDGYLRVKNELDIFALGDCATIENYTQPATAQVAQQAGAYLATQLNAMAKRGSPEPVGEKFKRINFGMLAYVGDNRALAELPQAKSSGIGTWLFWRSAYLTKLISLKNKALVLFDWTKAILFGRDISRF